MTAVYFRIRNDAGLYWTGRAFCSHVAKGETWPSKALASFYRKHVLAPYPTARIVRVTVTRTRAWPVERAREWLTEHGYGEILIAFAVATERTFRHWLATQDVMLPYVDQAVAEVMEGER